MRKAFFLLLLLTFFLTGITQNNNIKKVYAVFKTHFDLGYTELSSVVERKYIKDFIPQAIKVAEQLEADGGKEKYVWTTGAWLIDTYLQTASPEEVKKLEDAIKKGFIYWNAAPYTIQSEAVSRDMFETMLNLSKRLDEKYGRKTIAAKMTDVPGHTRSLVTPLADAGIRLLNVGVNNCSTIPGVPNFTRWRNTDGKEIILMYQNDYGWNDILPDGESVVSINFTGDNHGPHKVEEVKAIYASLRQQYPHAEIIPTSLSKIAEVLLTMTDKIPVLTSEIGDTWIFGYASSPVAMARYRALMRLYSKWLEDGKITKNSDLAIDYIIRLGLFGEHTWGLDHLGHIVNWDKYDVDIFNANRDLPLFKRVELSWQEKANRVDEAVELLPPDLKKEALSALSQVEKPTILNIADNKSTKELNWDGSLTSRYKGMEFNLGQVTYQTYSSEDYDQYVIDYIRAYCGDLKYYYTKPGLDKSKAKSASIVARRDRTTSKKTGKTNTLQSTLIFPKDDRIDPRVLPQQVHTKYVVSSDKKTVEMTVSLVNKPAVRLPEAYWVSFSPSDVISVFADKMGMPVDVTDVVKGGNRQMHGIDQYVDIVTGKGTIRITSLDAPVASIGERRAMNYSFYLPDLNNGVHFCLFNNLWTTNFNAWWEGSISYRFKIEFLSEAVAKK